jgi:hypothetical protein
MGLSTLLTAERDEDPLISMGMYRAAASLLPAVEYCSREYSVLCR